MIKFILERIFLLFVTLFISSIVIFLLLRLNGSDAALSFLHSSGILVNDKNLEFARHSLGLDKPILEQYLIWIKNAITLNFGNSYIDQSDVFEQMKYFLKNTFVLGIFSFCITIFFSFLLGLLCSFSRFADFFINIFSFFCVSVPNFWLAFLLIIIFSLKLCILPASGIGGIKHLILPAFSISAMMIGLNIKMIRMNMQEIKNSKFVIFAKISGINKFKITTKYIFLTSILPLITCLGMQMAELIGGAIIIENIFAYPGIGRYGVNAITNNDYPVVECFIILSVFIFGIINLISDILCVMLDPKLRENLKGI